MDDQMPINYILQKNNGEARLVQSEPCFRHLRNVRDCQHRSATNERANDCKECSYAHASTITITIHIANLAPRATMFGQML